MPGYFGPRRAAGAVWRSAPARTVDDVALITKSTVQKINSPFLSGQFGNRKSILTEFALIVPSLLPRHKKQTKEQSKSRQGQSEFSHKSCTVQDFNLSF